jgi:hypothetical protein
MGCLEEAKYPVADADGLGVGKLNLAEHAGVPGAITEIQEQRGAFEGGGVRNVFKADPDRERSRCRNDIELRNVQRGTKSA